MYATGLHCFSCGADLPLSHRGACSVCVRAGGPEVLEIRELPVPAVREGWSLVQVKGAGLNRSELRTRQGHSPGVTFPRVLGIECVGVLAASTDPALPEGSTAMP